MTIREFALKHLTDNGLFPDQAESVVSQYAAKVRPTNHEPERWWSDHTEAYQSSFLAVIVMGLNSEAVRWIDANIPMHLARPLFAGTLVGEENIR